MLNIFIDIFTEYLPDMKYMLTYLVLKYEYQRYNTNEFIYSHYLNLARFLLFNGISTLVNYLMPKPSLQKNSSGTI